MVDRNPGGSVLAQLRAVIPQRPLRYDEALRIAELQADRLLMIFGVMEAPVPSEIMAGLPRVSVEPHPDLPVPGSSHWSNGRWIVRLCADDHPRRQRYTLAHELKHILDHPTHLVLYSGLDGTRREAQVERIADHFAAVLLMPKRIVVRAFTVGIQNPYELARLFKVSPAAMRVRLAKLGLTVTEASMLASHQERGLYQGVRT